MEQALANTNEQTDSVLLRAKQNFVPSSKQLVTDTVEMITHPVQTAKSLYELGSGVVQLAIPGEQGNEDTARAVGQHFVDRYGSIEKAKETFATDPAGFAVDAIGVITGGAALGVGVAKAGAKAVSKVGRKIDDTDAPYYIKESRVEGELLDNYRNPYNEKNWDEALELRTKLAKKKEANKLKNNSTKTITEFDSTPYYHGSQIHNIKQLELPPTDKNIRKGVEKTFGSYSNPMWLDGIYITKNLKDSVEYAKSLGAVYKVNHVKDLKTWYEGQPKKNIMSKKIEDAFFAHLTRVMKKQDGEDYPTITKGSNNHFDGKWEDFKEKNSLHSHQLITYGNGKEKNLFYQEAGFNAVDSSTGAIPGTTHTNELIILNSDDLIIKETKNIKEVKPNKFKTGGTIMGLATGGIPIPGVAEGDGLKNPSIVSPEDAKTKAAAADIKKKISGVAKKPQGKDTNIQTAMLLEPEKLLEKYKNVLAANEGAMPVVEEEFTPSDYFKTEMMKQWLFAEGSTGDKDGQETNQAFKGIHIDSYPEFAEEIKQGTLTDEKVAEIMYRQYTGRNTKQYRATGERDEYRDLSQLEDVSPDAAKLLFMDAGYTGQNAESIKDLQKYLKVEDDGLLGEDTLGAMQGFDADKYRTYLGTLDRYTGEKGSRVYNRFFTEEERQSLNLYEKELTTMASGGVIDIQKFMDGGLADNADDTPGATESEVADDIPAMISEGELVVPANVVRYHGLAKYENMRNAALKNLDALEDNGQIRPVDSDGTPIVKDIKEQTDEVMASKGATVARYNEGGSPKIEDFSLEESEIPKYTLPVERGIRKDLKPVGPRVTTREGQTITPDDSGNKATLITPENKNYRVTNPDTKITATGPRTTGIVGGGGSGVDLENMPGFGTTKPGGSAPSGPNTVEKILSGVTTIAALDKLFLDGKITDKVLKWGKENIFDPVGRFLGFKPEVLNAGPLAGASILNGQLMLADGTMDIVTSLSGADAVGKAVADGTVIGANSWLNGIPADAQIVTRFADNASVITTDFGSGTTTLGTAEHYATFPDANGVTQNVKLTNAQKLQLESGNAVGTPVSSGDGLFSWKGGLATIGAALSLYDIIENGPSVTNVAGLGASAGGMINAGVFGLSTTSGLGSTALGKGLAKFAGPLAYLALAAGLVEAFSGPPSNKVAEAAINFDNPEYKESDILVGGFWTKKRSDENIDAVTQLSASIGSYVSSMEQALEINIGGELFLDMGTTRGLRYGYVDGYDELGMYKYHKKDLDYKTLQSQKGFK